MASALTILRRTGTGDLDETVTPGIPFSIAFIRCHFRADPASESRSSSKANLTISLNSSYGEEYNATLFVASESGGVGIGRDLNVVMTQQEMASGAWSFDDRSGVRAQWTNPGGVEWGLEIGIRQTEGTAHPELHHQTGNGDLDVEISPGETYFLTFMRCHFSDDPATAGDGSETPMELSISLVSSAGKQYDCTLFTFNKDGGVGILKDAQVIFDTEPGVPPFAWKFNAETKIAIQWTNPGGVRWGLTVGIMPVSNESSPPDDGEPGESQYNIPIPSVSPSTWWFRIMPTFPYPVFSTGVRDPD